MTSITQTIPSFTGGISQQPDELVLPGQVKNLVNGVPDITDGLVKRPGSRFISALSGAGDGTWFSYYRDKTEGAYIGQVQRNGTVKLWHANDVYDSQGNKTDSAGDVAHPGTTIPYLVHTTDEDLKFLTVADTTFVTNSTKDVKRTSTVSPTRGASVSEGNRHYQAFVELRQLAHGREYSFDVSTPGSTPTAITSGGKALSIHVATPGAGGSGYTQISRGSGNYQGIDPSLQHQSSEIFLVDSGNGRNLVFRLTATGQVAISKDAGGTTQSDDYVGIYNVTTELLHGGYGWNQNQTFTVSMQNVTYTVTVKDIQQVNGKVDKGFFRPDPTSFDANTSVSADGILSQVVQGSGTGQINLTTVQVIGNGIFLADSNPFVVETKQPDLWRITPMEINDPTQLPRQCKHGMIVRVMNSSDSQEDDYYLKFVGDAGDDGPGRWEETVGPNTPTTIDGSTMPHVIQRQSDGTFTVGQYQTTDDNGNLVSGWTSRQVGDNETNPFPSFISKAQVANHNSNDCKRISQTFFHRNRLGFLCEDNIILSRAAEPGNFFQDSALVVSGSDPIDIQASSTQPTLLKNAIETNTGLVVFAETQQFLLHTDSDALTPETGKVSNISTYRYSPQTNPISLGTTIAFVDSAGRNGRFFEMFDIRREGEPNMIEQTKVVPRLLPTDLTTIANSRENNTVFMSKAGEKDIFGYRYFNTGDRRVQSAWFKWTLPFNIQHLFVLDDELYIIENSNYSLLKIPLQEIDADREVNFDDIFGTLKQARVHLDSSKPLTAGSYNGTHTEVSFVSAGSGANTKLAAVNLTTGETFIEDTTQRNAPSYKFFGDFGGDTVVVGWIYEMLVELPRIFVKKKAGEQTTSDITASLTLQRANMRFGSVGQIAVELFRVGKLPVTIQYESIPMDFYEADEAPIVSEKTQTVPIYERNINCSIILRSNHPGPASFHSMTWEGDYTPMHHQRV